MDISKLRGHGPTVAEAFADPERYADEVRSLVESTRALGELMYVIAGETPPVAPAPVVAAPAGNGAVVAAQGQGGGEQG